MKKALVLLCVAAAGIILQGCATAMSKDVYTVDVRTDKPNKAFKVYNRKGEYVHQGTTPMLVSLPASSANFTKEIYTFKTMDGKKMRSRTLTATITPIYWGNFITIIGFAVDGVTGAMWALPKAINIDKDQKTDVLSQNTNF